MLSLVLLVALAQAGDVHYSAPANHFDSSEMGSEAIFAGMHICFEQRGGFSPEKIKLCGCLMDAARLNIKQGKPKASPTKEQAAQCGEAMPKPPAQPPKPDKGKIGT